MGYTVSKATFTGRPKEPEKKCDHAFNRRNIMVHIDPDNKTCGEDCHYLVTGSGGHYICTYRNATVYDDCEALFANCPFRHLGSGVYQEEIKATKLK